MEKELFSSCDDRDRIRLCFLLQEGCERHGLIVHGFCFMSNHIHLVLEPTQGPLHKGVHAFSSRYAQYFNRSTNVEAISFKIDIGPSSLRIVIEGSKDPSPFTKLAERASGLYKVEINHLT